VRRYGCALRSFLRYCYLAGLIEHDLSAAALPVSGRRRSLLPQGIGPAQAKALLGACDRRRATGRRDYAVIVLMLRLGLRAGEVAALRLEDLDWRAGQVTVHGKGGRMDQLPLPVDVGEAIAGYLRRGRPRTAAREVFLRVRPPRAGLTRSGVTNIVLDAARRAGLGAVRAHRLRHTAAGDMLRAGAPLAEIGQVLRHRSLASTAAYARVDVERLRTIARPWPTGATS
jgi:site-specific recombinase XerD